MIATALDLASMVLQQDDPERPATAICHELKRLSECNGERLAAGVASFSRWLKREVDAVAIPPAVVHRDASAILAALPQTLKWKLQLDLQGGGKRAHFFPETHKVELPALPAAQASGIAAAMEKEGFVTFAYCMDSGIGRRIMFVDGDGQMSVNGVAGYRTGGVSTFFARK